MIWLSDNCKPAIDHDMIARIRLDGVGVLDSLSRHLREGIPFYELALFLVAEYILLAIGTIPYPVEENIQSREHCESVRIPAVFGWVVVGQVESTAAKYCKGPSDAALSSRLLISLFSFACAERAARVVVVLIYCTELLGASRAKWGWENDHNTIKLHFCLAENKSASH